MSFKLFIACIGLVASFHAAAQGNLQFNQVLNIEFTSGVSTTYTVPAGKVWKMENVLLGSLNNYACMNFNGTTYYLRQHNTSSSSWDNFPFWLGTGQTFSIGGSCSPGLLSIIEFNVVE
jgi:hypothetical protein